MGAREIGRRCAVHLALWTIAIGQPLLGLYGENLAVFTSAHTEGFTVLLFAVVVLTCPVLVISAIDIGVARSVSALSRIAHLGCVFVGAWAVSAVVARSVTVGNWFVDLALSAAIGVVLTAMYARWAAVRTWSGWMSLVSPVVLGSFVVSAWPLLVTSGPAGAAAAVSDDIDVVWIQLDEAPLFPLVGTDGRINADRFPGFATLASVSTWYRDAIAVSQRTSVAVPSMLTGTTPDYSLQPLLADYPRNILTLVRDVMDLDVVEEATRLCRGGWCDSGAPDPVPRGSFVSLLRDAAIVVGHTLFPEGLRERLPVIDEGWGGFAEQAGDEAGRGVVGFERGRGGERLNASPTGHQSRLEHFAVIAERQGDSTNAAFRFAHLLLPHRPWLLAPDQRIAAKTNSDYRPGTLEDKRRDAYQSLLNQYVAVDAEIGRLVERLRSTKRWDKTMLIVTADHGITFIPGASPRDEIDPTNTAALDDVYRVPLFIKMPGQEVGVVDDCAVGLLDIVPTVAARLGVEPDWPLDGVDLARGCPDRGARTVTWIEGSTTADFGVDALRGRVAFYDRWIDADGDVDDISQTGPFGDLVGTTAPAEAPLERAVKWTLTNAEAFENVTDGRFARVPTRATGLMTARRSLGDDEELLVAVNGRFLGVVREAAGLAPWRPTLYSSSLQSRWMRAGDNDVSMWLVRERDGVREFTRLEPMSR